METVTDNPPATTALDWPELEALAHEMQQPGTGALNQNSSSMAEIDTAITTILEAGDYHSLINLRLLFNFLLARDTATGFSVVQRLELESIKSAEKLVDLQHLADFLGARGHNLHRFGYHEQAIDAFSCAQHIYLDLGQEFSALKSYYMTSLCLRALGNARAATTVLNDVLASVSLSDPWRGNPLQVKAWLLQDQGDLEEAEQCLREALALQRQVADGQILVAGTLADLGEILGLQGRGDEAFVCFDESLDLIREQEGQYARQEARTLLKRAQLLIRLKRYDEALGLLEDASIAIGSAGHYYDLFWRLEYARLEIHLRKHQFRRAIQKTRSVLTYRRHLSLSNTLLLKSAIRRSILRVGPPR